MQNFIKNIFNQYKILIKMIKKFVKNHLIKCVIVTFFDDLNGFWELNLKIDNIDFFLIFILHLVWFFLFTI